jgi:hypothetical protein
MTVHEQDTFTRAETDYERIVRNANLNTSYSPDDFVGDYSSRPQDAKNPVYVVLDAGYVLAVVFGERCEEDALDAACDHHKLDSLSLNDADLKDYETGDYQDVGNEYSPDGKGWPEYEGVINLGNAGEPFASESLDIWILRNSDFAEDPALMTIGRVTAYLDDLRYDADRDAKKALEDKEDEAWMRAYRRRADLDDALTVCRMAGAR